MSDNAVQQILQAAALQCQQQGLRFTTMRNNTLQLMLKQGEPLSAYDIMAIYKRRYQQDISAVSVYRMLDFLMQAQLVHKLLSSSQYITCSHIACQHAHEIPQLLICDRCHQVEEISAGDSLVSELEATAVGTGFKLHAQQLELHGICAHCQS